jgi:hypothetical protein
MAAAALYSSGIASQHNSPAGAGMAPAQVQTPMKGIPVAGGHLIFGINVAGNVYAVDEGSGSSVLTNTTQTLMSGLSRLPGTRIYYMTGGMADGGNLYIAQPGPSSVLLGNSGVGAVPGLAFDPADSKLYGTYTASLLADGLAQISTATGAATPIGFMGAGGIDSLAISPVTGTLFGSTGFFFDGSPGDVFTINKTTGLGTKIGVMSPLPPSVVAGMAFASDGQGYISIGAGNGGVWRWNATAPFAITVINGAATLGGGSMTDIEVGR